MWTQLEHLDVSPAQPDLSHCWWPQRISTFHTPEEHFKQSQLWIGNRSLEQTLEGSRINIRSHVGLSHSRIPFPHGIHIYIYGMHESILYHSKTICQNAPNGWWGWGVAECRRGVWAAKTLINFRWECPQPPRKFRMCAWEGGYVVSYFMLYYLHDSMSYICILLFPKLRLRLKGAHVVCIRLGLQSRINGCQLTSLD